MKNIDKIKNKFVIIIIFLLMPLISVCAQPITGDADSKMFDQTEAFTETSGFEFTEEGETGVAGVMATVIRAFLSLLGIIFIILILTSGYKWMTAGGNEQKVDEAKSTLQRAVVGLVIAVSAFAITHFVFTNLPKAGSGSGPETTAT